MQRAKKNRRQAQAIQDIINSYHTRFEQPEQMNLVNPYEVVEKQFKDYRKNNKRLLVLSKDTNQNQAVVLTIDYVAKWWARGTYKCVQKNGVLHLPFTIHYQDIIQKDTDVRVIPEGERSYEE